MLSGPGDFVTFKLINFSKMIYSLNRVSEWRVRSTGKFGGAESDSLTKLIYLQSSSSFHTSAF